MSNKDLEDYLESIRTYTEKINNQKIPSQESVEYLVKSGICNDKNEVSAEYRLEK